MKERYAKIVNGRLQYAPNAVKWTDEHGELHKVNNPSSDKLLDLGYKPVTYTDPPEELVEGKHYESSWEETETEILQTWHLADDPVYPDPEPTMADLIDAVERGLTT